MSANDITTEAVKAAPPVAVSAWISVASMDIDFWIKALTILYLVLQIVWLVVKMRRKPTGKDEE